MHSPLSSGTGWNFSGEKRDVDRSPNSGRVELVRSPDAGRAEPGRDEGRDEMLERGVTRVTERAKGESGAFSCRATREQLNRV